MRKTIVRLLYGFIGLLILAVLAITALIGYDFLFPSQRITDFANVTYPGPQGTTLNGYLARPGDGEPGPALLLIHAFYGLDQDIIQKADLLAQQGYTVLAVDAFRGQTTRRVPRGIWLVVTTPQDEIRADIDAAYTYLAGLESVDPQRIGVVGFCFGGSQAMFLGTRNPDLRATVIFYGGGPITDPAELGFLGESGPVLGIYGAEDQSIPLEQVSAFEAAMNTRGISNQISVYPGVGHAFVHADNIAQPGAAQDAWNEMLTFLSENLGSGISLARSGWAQSPDVPGADKRLATSGFHLNHALYHVWSGAR